MKKNDTLKIEGKIRFIDRDAKTGQLINVSKWYRNTIVTTGKIAIARRLVEAGVKANEGIITYGAVGTGTTAPAINDVKLETEYFRKLLTYRANSDNVCTLRLYVAPSEANTTWKEFGLFGEDASGTADSGTLFNRIAICKEKTTALSVEIEVQLTIS